MTPTTYGRDFAYCLKSHGGVRGFYPSFWRFLLRCTLFCHSVATFLTSVSSYEGGCGFEVELHLGKDNEIDVELNISDIEDRLKANIKVMDFLVGDYGSEKLLIPHLKDYLSKHPLLQYPDYPSGFENVEYYLSKSIPPKYTKEIYVALVLIVQDFFNDIAWYIS